MPAGPRLGVVGVLLAALGGGWYLHDRQTDPGGLAAEAVALGAPAAEDPAQQAFQSRAQGRIITVIGAVERILADDRDGSPHQRFIIRTPGGLTLLIAHNLDLAPRLEGLRPGDRLTVLGEYEWNEQGGIMHWTHDDPQGLHIPGYIEWRGRRYQ
jgi:hypothetical protein